jgi:protein-S-isoprenylcysteine O-methyltransferase Ste14
MTLQPPPLLLAVAAALTQRHLARSAPPTSAPVRCAAVVVATCSVVTAAVPVLEFRRGATTVDPRPGAVPSTLVTSGVNGVTRNPMYVGMCGSLLAVGLWRRAPVALAPAVAFALWLDRFQVPAEERALHAAFGEAWDDYRSAVPRWLPAARVARLVTRRTAGTTHPP